MAQEAPWSLLVSGNRGQEHRTGYRDENLGLALECVIPIMAKLRKGMRCHQSGYGSDTITMDLASNPGDDQLGVHIECGSLSTVGGSPPSHHACTDVGQP